MSADVAWVHFDIILTDMFISFLYLVSVLVSNCKHVLNSLNPSVLFDSWVAGSAGVNIQVYAIELFSLASASGSLLAGCAVNFDMSACTAHRQYLQASLPAVSGYALVIAAVILLVQSNIINRAVKSSSPSLSPYEQGAGKELKVGAMSEMDSTAKRAAVAVTPKDKLSRAIHMHAAFNTISKQKTLLMTPKTPQSAGSHGQTPGSAISGVTMTPRLRTPGPHARQLVKPKPAHTHQSPMLPVDSHIEDAVTPAVHYQQLYRDQHGVLRGEKSPMTPTGHDHDDTRSIVSHTDQHVAFTTRRFVGADGAQTSTSVSVAPLSTSTLGRDSPQHVLRQSVEFPAVLVGWRIHVPMQHYGDGIVLAVIKKKFRATHFQIQFDSDPATLVVLPLQRSVKKGTIPFTLISRT
jgi:hypothetical protein